ncbi:fatty acyl CoA synthetase [Luteimonas sp. BDR2-5]|uniref:LolA-related protein n=1 Tax=Proluteimonas luteida TaxID=2878685 RepID=UPI001E47FE0F|nr:LolA-related protein [Luteimonas sp. BDR2-5]MCD9030033.1 fatty acyl CoA synthetase [Luteimonas sp. BDR2-5]
MPGADATPRRLRRLLLACCLAVPPAWAAAQAPEPAAGQTPAPASVEPDWILGQLRRPPPAATPFVELRVSSMLKKPLQLAGEYRRPDADTLVREVRAPYAETTTIRAGQATLAREGRAPRTFALSRVPELAALQGSFGALLAGDRAQLEQHYTLQAEGAADAWTMTLTPKDPRTATRLLAVVLRGGGDELRCIETRPREGDAQPTLLGGAATGADAFASLDDALRACRAPAR